MARSTEEKRRASIAATQRWRAAHPERAAKSASAANKRWREAHAEAAKAKDARGNARRAAAQLRWQPRSNRADQMAASAKKKGYSVVSSQALRNPKFITIDACGRRRIEYLVNPEKLQP
jgi:hypothetical protein